MTITRLLGVIAGLAALLLAAPVASAGEFRIGFVAAITGPASSLGVPERDVAVLLQKELDAAGGILGPDGRPRRVRIIIHDDQSKADETVKAVKKLVTDDRVHVVIASSQSPTSLAVVPIVTIRVTPAPTARRTASTLRAAARPRLTIRRAPQGST